MASESVTPIGPALLRYKKYDIKLNHRLGAGSFGKVYLGEDTSTGKDSSTRVKICAKHLNVASVEFSQTEIDNMKRACPHDNIVTIHDHFVYMDDAWIVMEYCPGDTLDDYMRKYDRKVPTRVNVIYQMTNAVKHLHTLSPPLSHRDLKPKNIIVSPGPLVKVCDFGLSKTIDLSGSKNASFLGGTPSYMPPELSGTVLEGKYDAFKADIFSLGLVFIGTLTCSKDKSMEEFFKLEHHMDIGKLMHERRHFKQPVNLLRKKILAFRHQNSDVTRLMMLFCQMVAFTPVDRVDILEAMDVIADVYRNASTVSSIEPGEETTFCREAEGATPSRGEGGAAAGREAEGATPNRGAKEATKKTSVLGKLRARFGAASLETKTIPVSSIEPGEEATSSRGAEGATPSRGEGGAAAGREAEGARSKRGAKGATKKTPPEGTLVAKFGAASLETKSAHIEVRKLSSITVPSTDIAYLDFGQDSFIVGFKNDPNYHYYKYSNTQYKSMWTKVIPDGLVYDTYKQVSENGDIFIHRYTDEVWRHNEDLKLIEKLSSPGCMIGLLHGGKDAVLDNYAQVTEGEAKRVSVAPVTNLLAARYHLDIPRDGAYREEDKLIACGRQDGRVVVIAAKEPFVDFYRERGSHVSRAPLPHGAGIPGSSDTHVLVPLWGKPQICVFNWAGNLLQTLESDKLGLHPHDLSRWVSSVYADKFSLATRSSSKKLTVHTYKIV